MTCDTGDYAAARRWWEQGVVECRALGDWQGLAHALSNIGEAALLRGDYAEARARTEASLAVHRARGTSWSIVHPLKNLALLAAVDGQYGVARRQLQECVGIIGAVIQPRVLAET